MSASTLNRSTLLRRALQANAAFSTVSGLVFVAAAGPLSDVAGLSSPVPVVIVGLSLLPFALGLFRNSRREEINLTEARVAVGLDLAWVAGSGVIIALGILSSTGNWILALIAEAVFLFALAQLFGIRKAAS